jgi:ATP-dependent exoDNAse (exonuclease V) alpha subunit
VEGLTPDHVLVVDEAGQLSNRQAHRILELSRISGARVLLLGDNKQTGAIEQGKAFWLLQQLGMPTAQLPTAVRQETRTMKTAVAAARAGDYDTSIASLDRVITDDKPEDLVKSLVAEWSYLNPRSRAGTNILVLDNATRLIANSLVRKVLKKEGVVAAEETRLAVLSPAGMSDEEKRVARFYSGGQVVSFARDNAGLGIAQGAEYRVVGLGRDDNGLQIVRLVDENGRIIRWDPRLGSVRQVNAFKAEERELSEGDRIQWRLVNRELGLKNAERGTVEKLVGPVATIRWDRENRVIDVDLSKHKTWDHGYAETVYSAQSKTYDRVYVLAPLGSGLVNGQNYYTAITRARFGVKLWTQDAAKLAAKLTEQSGEKTSSLEGLGRLERDSARQFAERHKTSLQRSRDEQHQLRQERNGQILQRGRAGRSIHANGIADRIADRTLALAVHLERVLDQIVTRTAPGEDGPTAPERTHNPTAQPEKDRGPER